MTVALNHTSWVTAVTPTDRPKSVRNSCVIKVFGGVFMLSRCFLDCSVGVGVFVTGLSQISSFFSSNINFQNKSSCFLLLSSSFCPVCLSVCYSVNQWQNKLIHRVTDRQTGQKLDDNNKKQELLF